MQYCVEVFRLTIMIINDPVQLYLLAYLELLNIFYLFHRLFDARL